VSPDQDRKDGFREEDCVPASPRPSTRCGASSKRSWAAWPIRSCAALLERMAREHEAQLRIWPAAQTIHHAYRGGYLEHVLQIARVAARLADAYGADPDMLTAGAVLHDIGKLQELSYDGATSYSRDGRLLGHIAIGLVMVREAARQIPDFPPALLTEIEHIVLSHHGSMDLGSPVEPMTIEAFILSAVDDLDAKNPPDTPCHRRGHRRVGIHGLPAALRPGVLQRPWRLAHGPHGPQPGGDRPPESCATPGARPHRRVWDFPSPVLHDRPIGSDDTNYARAAEWIASLQPFTQLSQQAGRLGFLLVAGSPSISGSTSSSDRSRTSCARRWSTSWSSGTAGGGWASGRPWPPR